VGTNTTGGSAALGVVPGGGEGGQLAAGERASAGTVGFLGNPAELIVLNPGDPLAGTVFEGTSSTWDGDVLEVRANDIVIDGYAINSVVLHASGVNMTIRNCVVTVPQGAFYGIYRNGPNQGHTVIEDTTVICTPGPGITYTGAAIECDGRLTVRRCDVSGSGDAIHITGWPGTGFSDSTLVSQVYIHDLAFLDEEQHADYIQCYNSVSNYTVDGGQCYLTIEHSAMDISVGPAGAAYSAGITMGKSPNDPTANSGPLLAAKVHNNLIPAGAYHLRLQYRQSNCVVTNNDLGFRNVANGETGLSSVEPQSTIDSLTWSGNVDGNGDPYMFNDNGPIAP
jgi:hypothetical protein